MLTASLFVFQATRVIRGEYFRWQALPYYREVSRKVAEITPPGSECLSVYPELVHEAQCAARFDDFAEYSSGWSPKLNEIFKSELASGRYKTVVWSRDDFAAEFLNYHLVEVLAPPPMRARKLYVFAADPAAAPAYPK